MTSQNCHFRTANEAYLTSLMPRRRAHAVAFLLVLMFLGELVFSVHRQSLSWDEGDHIYAGYESWAAGEFGINPEHPPVILCMLDGVAMFVVADSLACFGHDDAPPKRKLAI